MAANLEVFNPAGHTDRAWIGMTVLSLLCHLLFFSGVVFLPELRFSPPSTPLAVEVDLVSLPLAGPQAPPPSAEKEAIPQVAAETPPAEPIKEAEPKKPSEPLKKSKEKPADIAAPPPKETVSLAPKPLDVKKSIKKKTYDPSKVISKALAKIEKRAPESRPRSVVQAIDQLKKEVQGTKSPGATGGAAAGTGMSHKGVEQLDVYHAEIWYLVQKNWTFPEVLAQGRTDLQAIINVKIMRDGKLEDIWFDTKSGNSYFDDSVMKALKKSDPLPPLPEAFPEPFDRVIFRFNLSELLRRSR